MGMSYCDDSGSKLYQLAIFRAISSNKAAELSDVA